MSTSAKPRILVLGGGFGGLETAFYLRMRLQDKADITLISDQEYFLFKPNTIYIPFGLAPEKLRIYLDKPTRRKAIRFVKARVQEIKPGTREVFTNDKQVFQYDYLVVATGASMRPDEIPGLNQYAQTIWTPEEMLKLRGALNTLLETAKAGKTQDVLFLVPPNNKCAGPLYEMVFMVDVWLRRNGVRDQVNLTWSTYEKTYIQAFGPRLHQVTLKEFEQRGIHHYPEYSVSHIEKGGVSYTGNASLPFDLLISFPPYIASTMFPSLPVDDRGFIATELETRQVKGHPEIYAAGDAGDFPVKQAFLAFLQSDAIAEHLSAQILGTKPAHLFEPVSMCVMEQFDTATFAQVPLKVNGGVSVIVDSPLYKSGSSPLWRLGKKLLGVYLPWRFNAGEPFHAGLPWTGMEMGLKVMSGILAR